MTSPSSGFRMPHLTSALAYAWLPCSGARRSMHVGRVVDRWCRRHAGSLIVLGACLAGMQTCKRFTPHLQFLYKACFQNRLLACMGMAMCVACLTLMSSAHMRLSKGSDSLNFSISGSVLPVKRPPHSFLVLASGAGAEAGAAPACRNVMATQRQRRSRDALTTTLGTVGRLCCC